MDYKDLDKIISILERIKILFFGKTVDWINKSILICGMAMMSEPLLEMIINAFLKEYFDFTITGDNDVIWGFILVLLSAILSLRELIYNYFISKLKQKRWEILIPNFLNDFQNLNDSLNEYTMLFNEYNTCIANKGNGCASSHEKERVEHDKKFLHSIKNFEIILGKDITKFYIEVRKIMSKSFHSEIEIYYILDELCNKKYNNKFRPYHITNEALKIYNNYFNVIKEINEKIIKSDIEEKEFFRILEKYDIDKEYNTKLKNLYSNLAEEYIFRKNTYL